MTNEHPLTDEICREIKLYIFNQTDEDCMRHAADWQLEQVIEWMKGRTAKYAYEHYVGACFDEDEWLDDLKKAMRPQQLEDTP